MNRNTGNRYRKKRRKTFQIYSSCLCCGSSDNLTIDHITPISKGGTNANNNLQTLCHQCNLDKGDHIRDYRDRTSTERRNQMTQEEKELVFEEIEVGLKIIDSEGNIETVVKIEDIHNVIAEGEESTSIHCLCKSCELYRPIYKFF